MAITRKKIEITADKILLPPGEDIRHTGTSYIIATNINFTDDSVVHKKENDRDNLYSYIVELDIDDIKQYYVKVKYHYVIKGANKEGSWTRPVLLNQEPNEVAMSTHIVYTPKITANYIPNLNQLEIMTSNFNMFTGVADHKYTNYKLVDSDNSIIYERKKDEDNLLSLQIMDKVKSEKLYSVQASHTDDLGNSSLYGRSLLFNYSRNSRLFTFEVIEPLVMNRKFYFKINIFTPKYKSYDMEVRDVNNDVIIQVHDENKWTKNTISYLDLSDNTIYVEGKTLEATKEYVIYLKLYFIDNTHTAFEEVYRQRAEPNKLTAYNPLIKYTNRRVKGNDIMTDGISHAISRELFDRKVINTLFKGNQLALYTNDMGKHIKIKDLFDFNTIKLGFGFEDGDNLQVDYINILQLPTHDILVDVCLYNGDKISKTAFLLFEYDPFRSALSKDFIILPRDNELLNTSISNSLVVCLNNDIYYIPAYLNNDAGEQINLVMYKWNVKENFFTKTPTDDAEQRGSIEYGKYTYNLNATTIELPFAAKANVSVALDKDDNVYIFGGSATPRYMNETKEQYWNRENNSIYKLNKGNNKWTKVGDFPASWSKDIYAMHGILRVNGEIGIFNASTSGPALPIQDIIVFNPKDNRIEKVNTDHSWDIPFGSLIIYNNGNIERISSKEKDPQKSVIYIANTQPPGSTDVDGNIEESDELIVEDGETVNIENIYKYRTITIKGTGILRWFRPQGIVDLDANCLILNRDRVIEDDELAAGKYSSILILGKSEIVIQG